MSSLLSFTILGIFTGAAYAIAASGLVLTYSTTRVFNVAHGAFGMVMAFMFWQVAAFREELSPETVRMLNDLAWVPFVGLTSTAVILAFSIGMAIFSDQRDTPVFPRWLGWFNVWAATMFTPGSLCVFFKHGPFAYNGLIAWYLPVCVFSIWGVLITVHCLRAIRAERDAGADKTTEHDADQSPIEIAHLARELAELRRELGRERVSAGS
jgi:hypothetical protein